MQISAQESKQFCPGCRKPIIFSFFGFCHICFYPFLRSVYQKDKDPNLYMYYRNQPFTSRDIDHFLSVKLTDSKIITIKNIRYSLKDIFNDDKLFCLVCIWKDGWLVDGVVFRKMGWYRLSTDEFIKSEAF